MELQKLFVSLALKGDEFKQGLEDAGRQAEGLRSRIGGAMGTAGRVATGAMLGIGAAAVAGFGLAMNSAISMNASLEQSTMQFTTLMGDADMAADHVAMLFELGAKTPFETGPIIQASKHLQVFGGAALNTEENLLMIGDAAAAVGAPFDEVAFWTGRMYSAIQGGQPFGEAAMRLQELGLLTPEVRQQMEGLQASGAEAGEVWGAMEGQLGTFTGAMELQAGSWAGITSTLSDTLQMLAANALAPFFELAKQGVQGLSDLLNSPAIQAGIAALSEKLTGIIQAITDFVTGLANGRDTATVFGELAFKLAEAFGATRQEAVQVYTAVKQFITGLMEIVSPIANAVTQFVSWKDVLIALGILVASVVIPAIIGIVTAMAPILLTVAAVIAVVALLRNAWEKDWGGIQGKVQAVIDFIVPLVKNAIEDIKKWWDENGARIVAQAQADWEALKNAISTAIEAVKTIISNAIANIKAWWDEHGAGIVETAEKAWNLIKGVIDGVVEHIQLVIGAFRLAFAGDWEAFGAKIFEIWQNAWNTVVEFLSGLWDMVLPWLTSLWDSIKTWFTTTDWGQLGRDIINGIVNGLQSAGQAIIDVIMGFAIAAWDKVKAFFGISSPSKLMYYAGEMIVQGFVDGIQDHAVDVDGVVDDTFVSPFARWLDMLEFGGKAGGLASGFAALFEERTLKPLQEAMENLNPKISLGGRVYEELFAGWGAAFNIDDGTVGLSQLYDAQSTLIAYLDTYSGGDQALIGNWKNQLFYVEASIDAMIRRNGLEQDYTDQQERLFALEKARSDLDFLKQQMDLLGLMNEHNIPLSALDGVTLGLGADPGQLMDIMVNVMEAIVRQTEYEMNNAFNQSPAVSSTTPGVEGQGQTMNVQTQNINGGQHIYVSDAAEGWLEQVEVLAR